MLKWLYNKSGSGKGSKGTALNHRLQIFPSPRIETLPSFRATTRNLTEESKMAKQGFVYIMGNKRPTLYIGVTSDLVKSVWEHKNYFVPGFCKRYQLHKLLYYERFDSIERAIEREKELKN